MFKSKTFMNIKITNNDRKCNCNKLLKIQLLLKESFISAVDIYMYGTVNVHDRVRTKNRNRFSRTFQGLFKDQIEFSRTTYHECNFTDSI